MKSLALILTVIASVSGQNMSYTPVVLWHGMGDTCCNPFSMGRIKKMIEEQLPGVFVKSLMVGDNIIQDTESGFFINSNDQVTDICAKIKATPELAEGYNALGFSQGGQFLRTIVQRCPDPPMHNLVTFGAQHQGVFGLPACDPGNVICEEIRRLLNLGAYIPEIQNFLVQAQYWHDPLNEDHYRNGSIFLADINNENEINLAYKENIMTLDNFVMVMFETDLMVTPIESSWFGFYAPGQDTEVLYLNQTQLYLEDRLGLKKLDEEGKLHFLSQPGGHLEFGDEFFINEIILKYLNN